MPLDLHDLDPHDLTGGVPLDEIAGAVSALETWDEIVAEALDRAYRSRVVRLLREARDPEELEPLRRHLLTAVDPRRRAELDLLPRPYATYWQALARLLEGWQEALERDPLAEVRSREHVQEIHALLADRELDQTAIAERLELGKATVSRVLGLMEAAGMIEREKRGQRKLVRRKGAPSSPEHGAEPQLFSDAGIRSFSGLFAPR